MKKMGKVARLASLLVLTLLFGLFPIGSGNNLNKVQAVTPLNNPRTVADSSMNAKQKVTWDCVWFGAYPQSEVTSGDIYNKLKNATGWDENNDIVIDGNKYRRLKGEDAICATSDHSNHYNWREDYSTYHYFKYEPIKWRVLEVGNGRALLLADQVLDTQKYNKSFKIITWENSSIRSWLNGREAIVNQDGIDYTNINFINAAFNTEEQKSITTTKVINDNNRQYETDGGSYTLDKIFLLSESEAYSEKAEKYGFAKYSHTNDEARRTQCSTYAYAMGCFKSAVKNYTTNVRWWLRSPGTRCCAVEMLEYGDARNEGVSISSNDCGVRPALYLNLLSTNLYFYAGTICSDGTEGDNSGNSGENNQEDTNNGNNSGSNNNTGNNNSNNANNTGNNSNNTNNNKNNTTAYTKPSNKTTASKKPTKRALLPVEKMTGSLKSVKSPAKSTLAIPWKKLRKVTGYQVQFCAKSNFKKGTIERKFKQKVTKTKVRPVKSKKKYYVRMRPYTKSGSKTYYGKWSKVKSVKIK